MNVIAGKWLRALFHAVNAGEAAAPDGDLTDQDIDDLGELAKLFRSLPHGVTLVPVTRAEARALLGPLDNSLKDDDYRRDWMDARKRKLADGLAAKLDEVAWKKRE